VLNCLFTRKANKSPNNSNGEALMERSGINLPAEGTQAGALNGNKIDPVLA